jgi:hypothetical protein
MLAWLRAEPIKYTEPPYGLVETNQKQITVISKLRMWLLMSCLVAMVALF